MFFQRATYVLRTCCVRAAYVLRTCSAEVQNLTQKAFARNGAACLHRRPSAHESRMISQSRHKHYCLGRCLRGESQNELGLSPKARLDALAFATMLVIRILTWETSGWFLKTRENIRTPLSQRVAKVSLISKKFLLPNKNW